MTKSTIKMAKTLYILVYPSPKNLLRRKRLCGIINTQHKEATQHKEVIFNEREGFI